MNKLTNKVQWLLLLTMLGCGSSDNTPICPGATSPAYQPCKKQKDGVECAAFCSVPSADGSVTILPAGCQISVPYPAADSPLTPLLCVSSCDECE